LVISIQVSARDQALSPAALYRVAHARARRDAGRQCARRVQRFRTKGHPEMARAGPGRENQDRAVKFELNGSTIEVNVPPRTTLADCLRHHLMQTGTHVGCEHGVCGACTVIVDGEAVRSCLMLAAQAEDTKVTTVQRLSTDDALTALQKAIRKHHDLQ